MKFCPKCEKLLRKAKSDQNIMLQCPNCGYTETYDEKAAKSAKSAKSQSVMTLRKKKSTGKSSLALNEVRRTLRRDTEGAVEQKKDNKNLDENP